MNGYKSAKQNPGKTLVANFVSLMTLFLAILLISGVFFYMDKFRPKFKQQIVNQSLKKFRPNIYLTNLLTNQQIDVKF